MKKIKAVFTDCDGVLTDGGLYYNAKGQSFKKYYCKDSPGFSALTNRKVITGVITGDPYTKALKARKRRLSWNYLFWEVTNKLDLIKKLAFKNNITLQQIAYIGDDINDLAVLNAVGVGACPSDAYSTLLKNKNIILMSKKGGTGVFREFVDYLILNNYV